MAGSSGNWFSAKGKGVKSAKGKVFISNDTLLAHMGAAYNGSIAGIKEYLNSESAENNPYVPGYLAAWSSESPQPGGQAKTKPAPSAAPATPAKPEPKKGTITVTQANGKKVQKEGIVQGDLAVVTTPYGHAVVHEPSGKALLYIDGDKQLVYNDYKKKNVMQSAPSDASELTALTAMDALNGSSGSWSRQEAESLSPGAQQALKQWAQSKGVKATDIKFAPPSKTSDVPAAAPAAAPEASSAAPAADDIQAKLEALLDDTPAPSKTVKTGPGGMTVKQLPNGKYQAHTPDGAPLGGEYATQAGATKLMNKAAALTGVGPAPAATKASAAPANVPTAKTVAPTSGYQHTFTTTARGTPTPLSAAKPGDQVSVPYLKQLKNGTPTAGQGSLVSNEGGVAIVKANGLYHAVDAATGNPLSVHHQTPAGALSAAQAKQGLLTPSAAPAKSTLPAPKNETIKVGKTSGSVKDMSVQAEVYGPLALNLDTNGSGWTVSHVDTGYQMAKHFPTKTEALKALEAGLESGTDWGKYTSVGQIKGDYAALGSVTSAKYASSGSTSPTNLNPLAVPTGKNVPANSVFNGIKVHDWGFDVGSKSGNYAASTAFEPLYKSFVQAANGGAAQWWTAGEKSALEKYQGNSWYAKLNNALWSGSSALASSAVRTIVRNLDTVMAKSGSPIDITVTKGQGMGSQLWNQMAEIQEGGSWSPMGFDSGKLASPLNDWGGGGVRVHYQVPGGVTGTGVHYNSLPESIYSSEVEFLISRNTKWKVGKKTVAPNGSIEVVMVFDGFRGVAPGQWPQNYPVVNP